MSIEVLTADKQGSENLQRWAAMGLPVPPSWRLHREDVLDVDSDDLVQKLRALPRMFDEDRYWVLQQGPMNPGSCRESLLNLDSDNALAAALRAIFRREQAPEHVIIQALPHQKAAGVLFTRHPLRQDLPHMVVEGVADGNSERQRIIFDEQGRLVHASHDRGSIAEAIPHQQILALHHALKQNFDRPQAGEWVYDGHRLWLLQTLPVGSLPAPREAWTRRAGTGLFVQAESPLWYTLAARWFKSSFWEPLVQKRGWDRLDKIEPYRRQHSHIYTNCAYFLALQDGHPGAFRHVPPAWQRLEPAATAPLYSSFQHTLDSVSLAAIARKVRHWQKPDATQEALWHSLMQLDALGERLSKIEGRLSYLVVPDMLVNEQAPLPLQALTTRTELNLLLDLAAGNSLLAKQSSLRPGSDPVHAPLVEKPAQASSLNACRRERRLLAGSRDISGPVALLRQARALRIALGNRFRVLLRDMGALVVNDGLLQHPDDIYFLYFDELWQLWMGLRLPASASHETIADRKLRYLDDSLQGAPDWKMDQIGYGFGGGQRISPLMRGQTLVAGKVEGPIRRVCSAWMLNRVQPGDIVVVDQVDASWLPWLLQAGGIVISQQDPANPAASLAVEFGIPAIWSASDVMHSVQDERTATLDAEQGTLELQTSHPVDTGEEDE
ncbi:PEP-utilizing enzyme [Alcanivorax sediminis]|uniref:Pyruvate, phosphate dikinase n=1 Tax=Alcanivorax sediminis TaxID=2663008 RepID=A0A6N7LXQ3_9GAMM|nr:PEP-utilizing enzyme [Alcanivorax sediminis]MQX53954.1 pyruvate, phosphate dikinase [Alcanivorax sediminis]